MSSLSISGNTSSLFSYLQQLQSSPPTSSTAATDATTSTSATDPTSSTSTDPSTDPTSSSVAGAHVHHGHGKHGGGFFKKVQDAVTSALQSASSDSTSDPNSIVEQAIKSVLGGSDPTASGTSTTGSTPSTDSTTSPGDTFAQLLQSNGIDSSQFQQDFQSAVQAVQAGTTGAMADASSLFSQFPIGSAVDTIA